MNLQPTVDLDTCIVSAVAERDIDEAELGALRKILQAHSDERIAFVTSPETERELSKMSLEKAALHVDIYSRALLELPRSETPRRRSPRRLIDRLFG